MIPHAEHLYNVQAALATKTFKCSLQYGKRSFQVVFLIPWHGQDTCITVLKNNQCYFGKKDVTLSVQGFLIIGICKKEKCNLVYVFGLIAFIDIVGIQSPLTFKFNIIFLAS